MDSQPIFRKKSLERISSPDQLNDYMKATSPSVWLLLTAVLILLAGALVWSVFGRMETVASGAAVVEGGTAVCFVDESTAARLAPGMEADLGGPRATVSSVAAASEQLAGEEGKQLLLVAGLAEGTPVRRVLMSTDAPDGVYQASVVVESVSPLSFVTN